MKKKIIPHIKKKFFIFALVQPTPWNFKKCSRTKMFRCKLCVKSNFTNVKSHILLLSFISNYEDGQNMITQSLKPTRIFILVNKCMFKISNRNTREIHHWRRSGVFIVKFEYTLHFFLVCLMMIFNMYLFPRRDVIKSLKVH